MSESTRRDYRADVDEIVALIEKKVVEFKARDKFDERRFVLAIIAKISGEYEK